MEILPLSEGKPTPWTSCVGELGFKRGTASVNRGEGDGERLLMLVCSFTHMLLHMNKTCKHACTAHRGTLMRLHVNKKCKHAHQHAEAQEEGKCLDSKLRVQTTSWVEAEGVVLSSQTQIQVLKFE